MVWSLDLTLWARTAQNGQTYSKNLSAVADELFECEWSFCAVGAQRVNTSEIPQQNDNRLRYEVSPIST